MEDLINLLDEHPQFVDALRARLLPRDLIELPAKFAQFVVENDTRIDSFEARTNERIDSFEARTNERIDSLEARTNERIDSLEARMDRRFNRVDEDMALLKAAHVRNAAIEHADSIAFELGLEWVRNLDRRDLRLMADASDTSSISRDDLRSFREADLIIETTDSQGRTCYIAVEISFTANGREISRAIRNARFITDFTGSPAYPVVAGIRSDNRIRESIEAGEVSWYGLGPADLQVD